MSSAKNSSNKHFVRNGAKWTNGEDKILIDRFNTFKDYKKISVELQRSVDALQARMVKVHVYPKIKYIFYEHEKFNNIYFNTFYNKIVDDYSKEYNINKENFILYLKYADRNLNPKNLQQTDVESKESHMLKNNIIKSCSLPELKPSVDTSDDKSDDDEDYSDESDESDEDNDSYDSEESDSETTTSSKSTYYSDESDIDVSYLDDVQRKLKKMKNLHEIHRKLDMINSKLNRLLKKM